jgi:hypothetical protein
VVTWWWRSDGSSSRGTGEIAPAKHGETPSGRGLLQSALHSSETRGGWRCSTPAAASFVSVRRSAGDGPGCGLCESARCKAGLLRGRGREESCRAWTAGGGTQTPAGPGGAHHGQMGFWRAGVRAWSGFTGWIGQGLRSGQTGLQARLGRKDDARAEKFGEH